MSTNIFKNNYFKLLCLILLSLIIDNIFISMISSPPAWDQGYHLSNVFKMVNILEDSNLKLFAKGDQLLNITNSYRGPLTYFISALFIKLSNNSYHYAYLSNQIFNIISILSIFYIAKFLKNESTGIWAGILFTFSSLIINQRSDYLIDLSLTAFSTLNLLFFTKWYFDKKKFSIFSILSGISLGLIFLTKPTGIFLFFLPLLTIIIKKLKDKKNFIFNINQLLFFFFLFFLLIYPWLSRHWLTIFSSIINAWNWGVNYQDGFNTNSISSWVFYFRAFPNIFGILNFSVFLILFLFERTFKKNLLNIKKLKKINLWFYIYILNGYLLLSLMSTKDIRFLMPIYPLICIYLAQFITSENYRIFNNTNKKIIISITLLITLITSSRELMVNNINNNSIYKWPHYEIIQEIKKKNPNLTTILAVLPDTKEINTFNLEAEATKQGEFVSVRQVISNKNSYKEDLKYFDWFLVKTDDQGVMTNQAKNLLNNYLLENTSFIIDKEWLLPDKSKVSLLRRKFINTNLVKKDCNKMSSSINITKIYNGINIYLSSKGKFLKSSNLLIDLINGDSKKIVNISLANDFFHRNFEQESCYFLSQDVPLDLPLSESKDYLIKTKLLTSDGNLQSLSNTENKFIFKDDHRDNNSILMANRISKVEVLGNYLRRGEFRNLFNLIGIINQSDSKQTYLKNAEKIFKERYKENENLENLYNILISQILQRKVMESEKTINKILKFDIDNGNAFLVKAIINIYLLDKNDARYSINKAKTLEKSLESNDILNILEGLTEILEMKFINAYKTFT